METEDDYIARLLTEFGYDEDVDFPDEDEVEA